MGSGVEGLANPCSSEAGSDRLRFAKRTKIRGFITFALFGFYKSHYPGKCLTATNTMPSVSRTQSMPVLWNSKCFIAKP